jgi:ParB/RepB/Spo0J family partition protein
VGEVEEVAPLDELGEVPKLPKTLREDSRTRLSQRKRQLHEDWRERHVGPQGEARSRDIVGKVTLVPLDKIVSDTDFKNEMRLPATEDEVQNLEASMKSEGLKHPVVLIEHGRDYHVRWGFRRVRAARKLGWEAIPSIVIPRDTPLPSQYWSNIVENVARSKLHTYELARAAQVMRDKFRVDYREFARRTGYDPKYVDNLLRTIDNLPPELLDKWRERRPIPVSYFVTWAAMRPEEAVRNFQTYVGAHPRAARPASTVPEEVKIPDPPKTKKNDFPLLMATRAGLKRMDKLRFSIACHRPIDEATRSRWLEIVDFCMGQRSDVPGVHDAAKRQRSHRGRDGKRSKPRQEDVARFRLSAAGDPVEVTSPQLAELERSVGALDREQAAKLLEMLRQTR